MVLLLQRHEHFLYLDRGLAEQLAAMEVGGVEHAAAIILCRSCGLMVLVECNPVGARLGAYGCRPRRRRVGGVIARWRFRNGERPRGGDEFEKLLLRGEDFGVDFFEQGKVSDKLFREGGNGIGKVGDGREDVNGLVSNRATERISGPGAGSGRRASRRIRARLTDWLRPPVRRRFHGGRLGRLHCWHGEDRTRDWRGSLCRGATEAGELFSSLSRMADVAKQGETVKRRR